MVLHNTHAHTRTHMQQVECLYCSVVLFGLCLNKTNQQGEIPSI